VDEFYLTLNCRDCEQDKCVYHPQGRVIYNKEGCTRKVAEETAAQFKHYMDEVVPF